MLARATIVPDLPTALPPLPDWVRGQSGAETLDDAMFLAGAALGAIHPLARDNHALGRLWRQRLALSSTEAMTRLVGRGYDAATLRDHWYLTRAGDDPGPAGRLLGAWRALGGADVVRPNKWRDLVSHIPDVTLGNATDEAVAKAVDLVRSGSPVSTAADVAMACLTISPASRALALWLADAALAVRLRWPAPVPLLAMSLKRDAWKCVSDVNPDGWRFACASAYRLAASHAFDMHADLSRRAERLIAVAPKLRAKDAAETVWMLMSEDALSAQAGAKASDRSSRRLFDRLVELGAVRELTGRATFRLYGL